MKWIHSEVNKIRLWPIWSNSQWFLLILTDLRVRLGMEENYHAGTVNQIGWEGPMAMILRAGRRKPERQEENQRGKRGNELLGTQEATDGKPSPQAKNTVRKARDRELAKMRRKIQSLLDNDFRSNYLNLPLKWVLANLLEIVLNVTEVTLGKVGNR